MEHCQAADTPMTARHGDGGEPTNVWFDKMQCDLLIDAIMKMKIEPFGKTTIVAALFTGALCWSAAAGDATDLWNMNCAACHGKDGKGQTMMGRKLQIKDLTDAKVQAALTDDQAIKDIKDGVSENGETKMKAFGAKLTDDQIKDLVAHVRSFKPAQ